MKILLYTHIFLWYINNEKLTKDEFHIIRDSRNTILISAIVIWEILVKSADGKIIMKEAPVLIAKKIDPQKTMIYDYTVWNEINLKVSK